MRWIYGTAHAFAFLVLGLLVPSILLNAPLMAVLYAMRRRLDRRVVSWILGCTFAAVGAWRLYEIEWYDAWRHGVPSPAYLATAYIPSLLVVGFAGWFIGRRIAGRPRRSVMPPPASRQ